MFKTLRNALKIEDIRKKLIFTFLMLVVVRFGSQLPIPGANRDYFQAWFAQQTGDAFNFFDAFTGGSFTSMSLFAPPWNRTMISDSWPSISVILPLPSSPQFAPTTALTII